MTGNRNCFLILIIVIKHIFITKCIFVTINVIKTILCGYEASCVEHEDENRVRTTQD